MAEPRQPHRSTIIFFRVLTRLSAPHRSSGAVARDFLKAWFPGPLLRLSARAYMDFVLGLPDRAVTRGAAYDALVAATAAAYGVELITCDRRALPVYERYGVRARLLA